jgi:S-adenosylmethionine/arginine decarboxylase-like enzyme
MKMKLEHIHLTVNAKVDPSFKALPRAEAKRFVDVLLKEINMKPLGKLNWAEAEDLEFPGQSFVQMITTSHCSLHFFDHTDGTKEIYFDLYSCKEFDAETVIRRLDETFRLQEWHGSISTRAMGQKPEIKKLEGNKQVIVIRN